MNFVAKKTPVEVIKKGAFGGTYFRDIYSGVNDKWHRNSGKEFAVLKDLDQKYYCSNYHEQSVNKHGTGKTKGGLIYRPLWLVSVVFYILAR